MDRVGVRVVRSGLAPTRRSHLSPEGSFHRGARRHSQAAAPSNRARTFGACLAKHVATAAMLREAFCTRLLLVSSPSSPCCRARSSASPSAVEQLVAMQQAAMGQGDFNGMQQYVVQPGFRGGQMGQMGQMAHMGQMGQMGQGFDGVRSNPPPWRATPSICLSCYLGAQAG